MAWNRDAGDSSHNNGILIKKNEWSKAIKKLKNNIIKPEMIEFIERLKGKTEIVDFIESFKKESFKTKNEILEIYRFGGII